MIVLQHGRSTKILSAHWLHFQVTVSWSFLSAPFLLTILTKHQAFAPSVPISFRCKSRFFRVEFSLRLSAKAWQEKSGPWVHLLNWSNSESFLKIFSHCDVNDSLATWEINKNSFSSLTSLSSDCVLILPLCPFFAYHPHQTPSLCPFSTDLVPLQIQVLQGGVLFKAFGQGLTGEIWTLSAAFELIKLWVLSVLVLPSWTSLQPRDEGWRKRSIKRW